MQKLKESEDNEKRSANMMRYRSHKGLEKCDNVAIIFNFSTLVILMFATIWGSVFNYVPAKSAGLNGQFNIPSSAVENMYRSYEGSRKLKFNG